MKKFIVLDTEATNLVKTNQVNPSDMRVYDIGWIVADNNGTIYERHSYIVADVFFNNNLMNNAYYAEKLPQYYASINHDTVKTLFEVYTIFKKCVKDNNIKDIWAFNINFDTRALNATIKDSSNGFVSYFLPFGCKKHDIWDYATSTLCGKKYVKWCIENEYLTSKGNPQSSAEIMYRYITQDKNFVEAHTALQDCVIELAILLKAKKTHKKAAKTCGQGWRYPATIKENM